MTDQEQVRLEPDRSYDPGDPAAYTAARWRWQYEGFTSAWFATREAAMTDAAEQHPGVGIG